MIPEQILWVFNVMVKKFSEPLFHSFPSLPLTLSRAWIYCSKKDMVALLQYTLGVQLVLRFFSFGTCVLPICQPVALLALPFCWLSVCVVSFFKIAICSSLSKVPPCTSAVVTLVFPNLSSICIFNTVNFECRTVVELLLTSVTIYLPTYRRSKELILIIFSFLWTVYVYIKDYISDTQNTSWRHW